MISPTTAAVIAAYNQRDYVKEAVVSLAGQVDEIVVVDDASIDDTCAVLDSLRLPNLRVLRNEVQLGVSRTFNRAVAATTSDVLLIQGGDDRSLPGRAKRQADALADPAVSLVYSLPIVIDSVGTRLPESLGSEFLAGREELDPLSFLFFDSNYVCAPAVAVRRADYLRLGGFRGGLDLLQDYEMWLKLATEGRFIVLDEPVVEYRKHGQNASREYIGLDSPKQRRLSAEMEHIRNDFVARALPATLDRLAEHVGLDLNWFRDLLPEEKVAVIRLSHRDRLVLRRGVSFLFEIAGEPNGDERLARLHLDSTDLSRYAMLADHDNLEDVSRAIGVSRTLERITPTGTKV